MQKGEEISGAIKHMKRSGALWIVIFAFAAGIIMLIIGSNLKKSASDDSISQSESVGDAFEEYKGELESSIKGICSKVLGSGDVYILLDFQSSGQALYATNTNTSSDGDRREEYVIIGSGTNAKALYIGQSLPELAGIGVVCPQNVSDSTKNRLCTLLASTYGLPLTRISVI